MQEIITESLPFCKSSADVIRIPTSAILQEEEGAYVLADLISTASMNRAGPVYSNTLQLQCGAGGTGEECRGLGCGVVTCNCLLQANDIHKDF